MDDVQKKDQEAKASAKVDTEYHFEYRGLSAEYTKIVWGDDSKTASPNFAEFWDVADTMQPHRLVLGGADITMFNSYRQSILDSEVESAVQNRTGKSIADLMMCSDEEADRETDVPEMSQSKDL